MPLAALAARLLHSFFFFLSLLAKKLSWLRSSVSAKAAVWMGGGGAPGSELWVKTVCVLTLPGAASPRGGSQGGRLPRALVLRSSPGTASVEQGCARPLPEGQGRRAPASAQLKMAPEGGSRWGLRRGEGTGGKEGGRETSRERQRRACVHLSAATMGAPERDRWRDEKGAGLPGEPIRCYSISFSFTLH